MVKTLSKTGISTDGTITAAHVTQSIDALTGTQDYDITITGNTVVASLTASANVDFNGDLDVDGITNLDVVDIKWNNNSKCIYRRFNRSSSYSSYNCRFSS